MAEQLHEALTALSPTVWNNVPKDDLNRYFSDTFAAGELICNSVPDLANGQPFHDSRPRLETPNTAKTWKDTVNSLSRAPLPVQEHEELRKNWGKPLKFSQKENPLDVHIFKMAGHDRHGAWFARKSVHEGVGFERFKTAMVREFPETLLVQGAPGAGAKRGLSAERRVEEIEVPEAGKLEVYQLSAQMPPPVSPRDFLTLLLTTDGALTEKSAAELDEGRKHVPRHYMIVSKPLEHPDAPPRSSFVRGQYESVELIREIPLHTSRRKAKSTSDLLGSDVDDGPAQRHRGHTTSETDVDHHAQNAADEIPGDPELNPVEWIMITRSDPGGGIPRFMVDRGTPGAMISDISKFLNWACDQEGGSVAQVTDGQDQRRQESADASTGDGPNDGVPSEALSPAHRHNGVGDDAQMPAHGGILSSLTDSLEAGIAAFAPTSVSNYMHSHLHPGEYQAHQNDLSDDDSDTSDDSFMSAEDLGRSPNSPPHPGDDPETLSVDSTVSTGEKKNLNKHEKELRKIMLKREKMEQEIAKKREQEENKFKQSQEKEQTEQSKAKDAMEREVKKMDERHRKEMEKLEAKREREARKAEELRLKKDAQGKLSIVARERDELRSQLELFRRENAVLHEQLESLQRENTALATRLGRLGGQEALKGLQDEVGGRSRSRTARSESQVSLDSKSSGKASTEKRE